MKQKPNITNIRNGSPASLAYNISKCTYRYPGHIKLIDNLLVKLSRREYLGNFPDKRIILTSYGSALARTFGVKIKQIISEFGSGLFNIELSPFSKSAERFNIAKHEGGMDCVGAGGAITGKGADLLIIDDPVKNDAHANSINMRNKLWDWFNATALTRLEPNGIVVIIMTRWHEDDLCGRILKNHHYVDYMKEEHALNLMNNETWLLLKLPGIAVSNDLPGRKTGDALWPQRYSAEKLNNLKTSLGSYWFSTLYQQSPSPLGGGIFRRKYFRYFREDNEFYYLPPIDGNAESRKIVAKDFCTTHAAMDLALTIKDTSDYTVIIVFDLTADNDILILDVIRERFEGAEHINLVQEINERWNPSLIGIESVQYQLALIQTLLRKGLAIKALKPDKDKLTRALPMQARLEAGKVFFLAQAHWLGEFEKELLLFPHAPHDDQVDAFAYISYMISDISHTKPFSSNIKKMTKGITSGF
jgi:predicted phage terminase large subunit-like protein